MSQEKILLSICVPTYNQAGAVRKLLESLLPQYVPQMEILIRDDSENNETEKIVSELGKALPIQYFRGKKEGIDGALIFLTEQARGSFIWWIGDDVMHLGAIQRVLTLIEGHEDLSFIWVNSHNIEDKDVLTINDRRCYFFSSRDEVLEMEIGLLGFITATVFKRELALPGIEQARKHVGSAFVCMYIVLYVIAQNGRYYFLGTSCFSSNPKPSGEVRWYDQFQVFGINLFHIVKEFEGSFNKRQMRKALSKNLARVLKAILVERSLGLKTGFAAPSPKIMKMAKLYWSYPAFYVALPFILLPTPILRVLYALYKRVRDLRK